MKIEFKELSSAGVYIIENFMSPEECEEWIAFSEKQGYEIAKVNMGHGTQVVNFNIRNNERYIHDSPELAEEIWQRIQAFVPAETDYGIAHGLNERFRFYKYFPGQEFKRHKDGSYMRNIHDWSSYTLMIYLNDDLEGGYTKFPQFDVKPKAGMALIFKHEITHAGLPVVIGVKYVLRTDVMYKRKVE